MVRVINIGSRRELFVDDFLIHSTNARFVLQKPTRKGACFHFDAPYEGSGTAYPVLVKDGDTFRLYYKACHLTSDDGTKLIEGDNLTYACCIESKDGINWSRPSIGNIEYKGSKDNNIVFCKPGLDNFIPFIDTNPKCPLEERYKAFEGSWKKLFVYKSADGYCWMPLFDDPLPINGTFDSSNLAFWDNQRKTYWAYIRDFHNVSGNDLNRGIRDIRWSQSRDFKSWTQPELLDFGGSPDIPLYTSSVTQYYRAPHIFMGFPVRYVEKDKWTPSFDQLSDPVHRRNRMIHHPRYGLAITDCAYMTSRDGKKWDRSDEAFLRPGIIHDNNWVYGDCYLSVGMQETPAEQKGAPNEISMYVIENHWKSCRELVRYSIRPDGFVALAADAKGCETITKPIIFEGNKLTINVSTAAVGGMKIEIQDSSGNPIAGFTLNECDEIFGDRLDYIVSWNGSSDISSLAGQVVRLRFYMNDVDIYSLKFEY